MKAKDIQVGSVYAMKVSGTVVPVKVINIREVTGFGGRTKKLYQCVNQKSGRDCKAESAAKFRYAITEPIKVEQVKAMFAAKDRAAEKFNENECSGAFDGMSVTSDSDSGL